MTLERTSCVGRSACRPIIHFHIPKTGGTSVHATFQDAFGLQNAATFPKVKDADGAKQIIADYSSSRMPLLISGHMSPLALQTDARFLRMTIVRNPVEHLISYFCFCFRTRHETPDQLQFMRNCKGYRKNRFSGDDVERWLNRFLNDNPQTRFLSQSGASFADSADLRRATDALDGCELVGTTEQMPALIMMLNAIADLDIRRVIHANASSHDIIEEAPQMMHDRLRPYVEYDFQLYASVQARMANSPAWHAMLKQPPIPVLHDYVFRRNIREKAKSFYHASPDERRSHIRRRAKQLRGWITDLRPLDAVPESGT